MNNYDFQAINKEKLFYDKSNHYDPVNFKVRKNPNNEFGADVMKIVPLEGELRLLGNRHRDCLYYAIGLSKCKEKVVATRRTNYLSCKDTLDAMFRCYTNDSDSQEYHTLYESGKPYMNKFYDCYFKKDSTLENCMVHFEDSIRSIYRNKPEHNLIDY